MAEWPEGGIVADGTVQVEQRDELFRRLLQLTPGQRTTIVLRYWEDLSEAATAEVLGCSVGTVMSATWPSSRLPRRLPWP